MKRDRLVKALAFNKSVRIIALDSTNTVSEAQKTHNMWPTSAAALGRTLSVGAMMGSMLKGKERLLIRIDGGGPIGQILVEANTFGEVKGYVTRNEVYMTYNSGPKEGKLAVGKAVGNEGFIHISKDLGLKEMFTGSTPLQTGEIGDDFTYYFAHSEQTPSAVGVGVLVDVDYSVKSSGGFLIQLMPEASEETIIALENKIGTLKPVSTMIDEQMTPEDIIKEIAGEDYEIIDSIPVAFKCDCSRERFKNGIYTLDRKEIEKMIDEDGAITAECHFCNTHYQYSKEDFNFSEDK